MLDSNLPVFISVAESGSFSQAALRLGKSPQAVFKQITTYEEKLGVKLFDRSPTGMRLTPAGISVYKDAKFLLSFSKESIKRAKEIEKNEGNHCSCRFIAPNTYEIPRASLAYCV